MKILFIRENIKPRSQLNCTLSNCLTQYDFIGSLNISVPICPGDKTRSIGAISAYVELPGA